MFREHEVAFLAAVDSFAVPCVPRQRESPACTLQVWLVEQMAHNMAGLWLEGPDLCVEGTPAHNPLLTPPTFCS
jgi:hypothetical protein